MYGKLFESMYDGTLYGQWQAIVTLQQLVILADEDGVVDMTPPALAARTSIPLEIVEAGIQQLQQADKYSRTPAEEGRRIVLLDPDRPWGWRIVNYAKYRDMRDREQRKEYMREYMRERRKQEKLTEVNSKPELAKLAHTDTDTNTDITPLPPKGGDARFEEFWRAYPKRVGKAAAKRVWSRKRLNAKTVEIVTHLQDRVRRDAQWLKDGGQFIPNPATWLNRDGWEDEYSADEPGKAGTPPVRQF
jgi:hypothetical protein